MVLNFYMKKKLITTFFEEIAQESGKYCYGIADTMKALELSAIETLLVWENFDVRRTKLQDTQKTFQKIVYLTKEQLTDRSYLIDEASGQELEVVDTIPLIDWLANNYKTFGATLEIITGRSQEGYQFCKGFGGLGGLLRYKLDLNEFEEDNDNDSNDSEDFI